MGIVKIKEGSLLWAVWVAEQGKTCQIKDDRGFTLAEVTKNGGKLQFAYPLINDGILDCEFSRQFDSQNLCFMSLNFAEGWQEYAPPTEE